MLLIQELTLDQSSLTAFFGNCLLLAHSNRWMNQRLYGACKALTDEERKRERGAFFGSIHRTLNHLIVADEVWLRRFAGRGQSPGITLACLNASVLDLPAGSRLDKALFGDWKALAARLTRCARKPGWTSA